MTTERERRRRLEALGREADRIVNLILHTDLPPVDVQIQIEAFRRKCLERYPDGEELFEMVYASRFRRIWEQWEKDRPAEGESWPTAWED